MNIPIDHTRPGTRGFSGNDFSPAARVAAHGLAHLAINPLFWLVDKLGYSHALWHRIGRKMRDDVVAGSDFGDYRPCASDIVVCTYPKCGTNWTLQIAHQIATRNQGRFEHVHDVVPWPDFSRQDLIVPLQDDAVLKASPTGLRIIKTHLEWERVPYAADARYICVLRDPKDAFVSNYHFVREVFFGPLMPAVDTWLDLFCSDGFPFVWPDHVHGYWRNRDKSNVLVLTYEEMIADAPAIIARIASFMNVEMNAAELAETNRLSAFDYMRGIGHRFNPPALTPLASANRTMIRRGASGASGELLSVAQQQAIDDWCRSRLRDLGSDLPYDSIWGKQRPRIPGITNTA